MYGCSMNLLANFKAQAISIFSLKTLLLKHDAMNLTDFCNSSFRSLCLSLSKVLIVTVC